MSQATMTRNEVRALVHKPSKSRKSKAEYLAQYKSTPPAPICNKAETASQRALFERHDAAVVSIRLPLAPSTNHYWRSWVRPGSTRVMTHVSSEGQAYKAAVAAAWLAHWQGWSPEPLECRLKLLVSVVYPTKRRIDLDNRIKPLQDALCVCGAYKDDSQIDALNVIRGPVVAGSGWMDVTIESIASEACHDPDHSK